MDASASLREDKAWDQLQLRPPQK